VSRVVLDASAVLVLLNNEPGAEYVERVVVESGAVVSVVNWAEVLTKGVEAGQSPEIVREYFARSAVVGVRFQIEPLTEEDADTIARLRPATRAAGLGLGDRACLALAKRLAAPVVTVDRAWATVSAPVGVEVRLAR
jgi:PIN domain nuclease of toxin-antitoxin system